MKIKFGKSDSIYKIFKTIEKINSKKNIKIYIDPQNVFFENIWWGRQLQEILDENTISYEFIALDIKSQRYFMELGVDFDVDKGSIFLNFFKKIYDFFIKASNVHKDIITQRNYFSYIMIALEIGVIAYLFYFFYNLISPSAEVYIKPSYSVETLVYNFRYYPFYRADQFADAKFLSIPYYSGQVHIKYSIDMPVESISYLNKPSKGKLRILNFSDYDYPLLTNTKFVTDDGIVYRSKNWVDVGPGTKDHPTQVMVDVDALDADLSGNMVGERGNISSGTLLYIKNLKEGYSMKEFYAQAAGDFDGGETNKNGVVDQKDIDTLSGKLVSYIYGNKKLLLSENFTGDDKYLLSDDDMMSVNIDKVDISSNPGDKTVNVDGTVYATINIKYVYWKDYKSALDKYLKDRTSTNRTLIDIQKSSVSFGQKMTFQNIFAYPTKVNLIWGYDFDSDINGLKSEILSKIIGKDVNGAKDLVLSYSEISYASIDVHPAWYDVLPSLKSRINIHVIK